MQLTQEDIEFLKKNTKYDEAEIREWFKGFKVKSRATGRHHRAKNYCSGKFAQTTIAAHLFQVDCPDGQLGKDKILDMYSMILPVGNAKVFVDQIFRIFDKDGNGSIDFKVSFSKVEYAASFLRMENLNKSWK